MSRRRFLSRQARQTGDLVSVLPDRRPKAVQLRTRQQTALLIALGLFIVLGLGLTLFRLADLLLWEAVADVR